MHSHVKALGILHLVLGCLGLLMAVFLLVLFGGIAGIVGTQSPSDEAIVAVPILGGIGIFVSAMAALFSIPSVIAGIGLVSYKSWGRTAGLIASGLQLIQFPIGTALGMYGLWVLLSKEGTMIFEHLERSASYNAPRG